MSIHSFTDSIGIDGKVDLSVGITTKSIKALKFSQSVRKNAKKIVCR